MVVVTATAAGGGAVKSPGEKEVKISHSSVPNPALETGMDTGFRAILEC